MRALLVIMPQRERHTPYLHDGLLMTRQALSMRGRFHVLNPRSMQSTDFDAKGS